MLSGDSQSPVPNNVRLKAVEILGGLKLNTHYFVVISVDCNASVFRTEDKLYREIRLRWEWSSGREFGVHPSSAIEIKVYRRRKPKIPLVGHHLVGQHTRKFVELLEQANASLDLTDERGTQSTLRIKLDLSLDSESTQEFKKFMESVDSNISRLNNSVQIPAVIATALQITKNIMDGLSGAHPILKASWIVLTVLYNATQKVEFQDDAVRELAEQLREILAVANAHRNLLLVEGTENVIDEIGRMSLKVSSLVYEYARSNFALRAAKIQLSDELKTRILECQRSCVDLKDRFDRRIAMETNNVAQEIKDSTIIFIDEEMKRTLATVKDHQLAKDMWKWLDAPDSSPNYHAALERHQGDTFAWFLDGEYYNEFRDNAGFLWIKATAGCGKTVLCSTIIRKIEALRKENPKSVAYAYFFFDGRDSQKDLQLHEKLIRSLIRQLLAQCDGVPAVLVDLYGQGHQQPSIRSLEGVLRHIVESLRTVYIIIDSLDECIERNRMLPWIERIIFEKHDNLHLIIASRPERDISDTFERPDVPFIDLASKADEDIALYLDKELPLLKNWQFWDNETQREVQSVLRKGAQGMFRWVALQIAELQKCPTQFAVMKQLRSLPKGLYETYDWILSRIDEGDSTDTKIFLRLLSFSIRPMYLNEIAAAAAVQFTDQNEPQFMPSYQYWDDDDILERCSGFIAKSSGFLGKKVVKLSHFSVKEYLLSKHLCTCPGNIPHFYLTSAELSHSMIAQACLAYLLHFNQPDSIDGNFEESFPLAQYAAKYWIPHAQSATHSDQMWHLATRLFVSNQNTTLTNWIRIWDPEHPWLGPWGLNIQQMATCTPLYYASLTGLVSVAQYLLENGENVNAAGGTYGTALQAASYGGEYTIVEMLLEKGADMNLMEGQYSTALQAASCAGVYRIVELLIQKGADVNLAGGEHGTALQAASYQGAYSIVRLLIENGANVNLVGGQYGTALQAATYVGKYEIVKLLIEKGADINFVGGVYGTALQAALYDGKYEIVELLVKKGADVNLVGGHHGTALQAAACRGEYKIVKMLIENGADVNLVGGQYNTALQGAAYAEEYEIVKLLVEMGADVNLKGGQHGTALQAASCARAYNIVEFLIENRADVNVVDGYYGTALQAAACRGEYKIIKLLLEKCADVNVVGGQYGTALQAAAVSWTANYKVVNLLIENGADVNLEGGWYGNALWAAIYEGHTNVVRLLVDKGATLSAERGDYAEVLWAATYLGYSDIVQLLRDHEHLAR